jgi:hypothetical protein
VSDPQWMAAFRYIAASRTRRGGVAWWLMVTMAAQPPNYELRVRALEIADRELRWRRPGIFFTGARTPDGHEQEEPG